MKGFITSVIQDPSPESIFKVHGDQMLFNTTGVNGVTLLGGDQTGAGAPIGSISLSPMKAHYIKDLWITANKNLYINIYLTFAGATGIGNYPYSSYRAFISPGQEFRLQIDAIFSGSVIPQIVFFYQKCTDTDLTNAYIGCGVSATTLADDLNFSADKKMMWIGDSIPNGAAISSNKMLSFVYGTWKFLRETQGYNVQLISKCYSGMSSIGAEFLRSQGKFNVKQLDIIFYGHGVNDTTTVSTGQTSQATYRGNLDALKNWRSKFYPNIPIIILGPTSCQNATRESQLVTLRGWAAQWVTDQVSAGDPRVYFCNLGTPTGGSVPYNPTLDASFVSSDSPSDKVHQVETVQPAIANIITNFIVANNITI